MQLRRTILILLCALVTTCFVPGEALAQAKVIFTSRFTTPASNYLFTGKECTGNKTARAAIDYQVRYYKDGSKFKGKGECWGYAEYMRKYMGGGGSPRYYKKKNTHALVVKALKGCRPGTHIRFASNKKGGGRSHSLVIFKFTDKEVIWADNNYGWDNRIHYYRGTPADFDYGYKILYFVHQPKSLKRQSKLTAAADFDTSLGAIHVCWPSVKGSGKYEVLRSTNKKSGFRRIATTRACSYTDKAAAPGRTYYYRIKSARKKSNITSARQKLAAPRARFQILDSGRVRLSWKPVNGAKSYNIYTVNYDDSRGRKLATVKGTSWLAVDDGGNQVFNWGNFCIVAAAGSGSTSAATYISCPGGPQQVKLRTERDEWTDSTVLAWDYGLNAEKYEIYRADSEGGPYQKIGEYENYPYNDSTFNDTTRQSGQTYYYKIRGVMKLLNQDNGKTLTLRSAFSNIVTC